MIFSREALYAVHLLNNGTTQLFGIPRDKEDFKGFIERGYEQLTSQELLVDNVPTDILMQYGLLLEKYQEKEQYLIFGDYIFAYDEHEYGVIILSMYDDGTYSLEPMIKGIGILAILKQLPFLMKTKEVENRKEVSLDVKTLLRGLGENRSALVEYHKNGRCEYSRLWIDFMDYIIEYDVQREQATLTSGKMLREKISTWTKVGMEDESRNQNRL